MAIFFTSDTHFGHGGALGLYRRPFASVAAMNEALVERWNETVGPDDVVWHLGDFAIRQRPAVVAGLLARLSGRKHLVAGNNDPPATIELESWESVQQEFSKGGIPGFVHLYAGEEAAAVGVCSHLGPKDYIASTHRGHGHSIAKGCDPVLMMQELFAKKGGLCGGKGGSMHIADL